MNKLSVLIMGVLLVALVSSISLAIHYRNEGSYYLQQWEWTRAELEAEDDGSARAPVTTQVSRVVYVNKGDSAAGADAALGERIRVLETQLREAESKLVVYQSAVPGRSPEGSTSQVSRAVFSRWGGTNDVARREEFEKRRQERQQTVQAAFAKKAAFLLNRDTTKLSAEEKKEYEQMVGLLDETWKMAAQMQQPDLSRDQRREVMHTLRDNVRELNPLLESERMRQFRDLGASLGYSGAGVDEFARYITDIIEVTDINGMAPNTHGGGRGGSGRSGTERGSGN